MPHEIDTTTGQAAVFTTGQPPWHGLGVTIDHAATSARAIGLAGLDWTVDQWPLQATHPTPPEAEADPQHDTAGVVLNVPGRVANVRTDTRAVLGVVGKGYRVFQNREAFDFFDAIVGDKLAMYQTAGSLQGGRRVWMLARIPKQYHAGPEDPIQPYVLLVNSHDGSTSLRMIPTTVRVVCQNTLSLALGNAGRRQGLSIAHRASLDERVREARQKLGLVAARFDAFDQELHAMLDKDLRAAEADAYFQQLLPPAEPTPDAEPQRDRRLKILEQFRANLDDPTNTLPGVRGTAWGAYNAVSQWADHQRTFRGRDDTQRAENRLRSVWFGNSHRFKQQAYRTALALCN
jgi:phage/plasmid-like protein (TIGR03299 family)